MQPQIFEITAIEDSLEVYLNRRRRSTSAIYLTVLAVLLLAAALLPFLQVDVSVRGPGIIRPETEKHEVRSRMAGLAEHLLVRRGEEVRAGQAILTLTSRTLDERAGLLARKIEEVREQLADLEVLSAGAAPESIAPKALRSMRYSQEHAQLLQELQEHGLRAERARSEFARMDFLAAQQLVAEQELEEKRFQVEQIAASTRLLVARQATTWAARRTELRLQREEFRSQLQQVEEERTLLSIEAPVGGTMEELSSISPGSFVQTGEVLGVISPDASLLAEVYVDAGDIGFIHIGMPARLLIDAFNYHDWGFVGGRVTDVSRDFLLVDRRPVFRVAVALDKPHLTLQNGFRGQLRKGMTLQARFVITERTLLQLLLDDVNDWLHPWDFAADPESRAG